MEFRAGTLHRLVATGEFEQAEIRGATELEGALSSGSRDPEWGLTVETAKPDVLGELRTGSFLAEIYAGTLIKLDSLDREPNRCLLAAAARK